MKNVVFFTARDLSNIGGGERMLSLIANRLCDSYSIKILTPYKSQIFYQFDDRIKVETLGLKYVKSGFFRKLQYIIIVIKLWNYLKYNNINRFVACSSMAIILTSIIVKNGDERLIAWMHTSFYHPEPFYIRKFKLKNLHKFSIVSVNSMDMDQYQRYSKNVVKIPNPLPFILDNKSDCRAKKIISVGRLEKGKGFDLMIEICADIFQHYTDWTLDIYGQDDGERKYLDKMIADRKMSDRIIIHNPIENIQEKYIESSIFITTSRIESFSLVLLEACEAGLPCVAYDVPSGPRDIIQDNFNGYLVKDLDDVEFKNKLSNLMDSEALRKKFGINSICKASEFDLNKIIMQWKRFL